MASLGISSLSAPAGSTAIGADAAIGASGSTASPSASGMADVGISSLSAPAGSAAIDAGGTVGASSSTTGPSASGAIDAGASASVSPGGGAGSPGAGCGGATGGGAGGSGGGGATSAASSVGSSGASTGVTGSTAGPGTAGVGAATSAGTTGTTGAAGVSAGGTGATTANAALVAEEERMLRRYLTAAVSDSMAMSALTSTQTASLLYRSGHKRAAKELLCEQRQIYAEFQRTPWPCSPRTEAELRRIDPAPAPAANCAAVVPAEQLPQPGRLPDRGLYIRRAAELLHAAIVTLAGGNGSRNGGPFSLVHALQAAARRITVGGFVMTGGRQP